MMCVICELSFKLFLGGVLLSRFEKEATEFSRILPSKAFSNGVLLAVAGILSGIPNVCARRQSPSVAKIAIRLTAFALLKETSVLCFPKPRSLMQTDVAAPRSYVMNGGGAESSA